MRATRAAITALLVVCAGALTEARAEDSAGPDPVLQHISEAHQALYKKTCRALVRVHVDQSAAGALPPALKEEFNTWLKTTDLRPSGRGGDGMGGGGRRGGGGRDGQGGGGGTAGARPGRSDRGPGSFGGGGRGFGGPGGMANLVDRFLRQKAEALSKNNVEADQQQAAALLGLALRVEINRNGFSGDMLGLVLDGNGHALVLTGLLREAHSDPANPFKVQGAGGTDTTATFVGTNLAGGYSIIQLANPGAARAIDLRSTTLAPGETLMAISGSHGSVSWPSPNGEIDQADVVPDRFEVQAADDGVGCFLFDLRGQFVGVSLRGVGSAPQREINYIISSGKDVEPRVLGVLYLPLPADIPAAVARLVGNRPAFMVNNVMAGSPADKGGLMKGDIVLSVDGHGMQFSPQIPPDRKGSIAVEIIRNGASKTLEVPLD